MFCMQVSQDNSSHTNFVCFKMCEMLHPSIGFLSLVTQILPDPLNFSVPFVELRLLGIFFMLHFEMKVHARI